MTVEVRIRFALIETIGIGVCPGTAAVRSRFGLEGFDPRMRSDEIALWVTSAKRLCSTNPAGEPSVRVPSSILGSTTKRLIAMIEASVDLEAIASLETMAGASSALVASFAVE